MIEIMYNVDNYSTQWAQKVQFQLSTETIGFLLALPLKGLNRFLKGLKGKYRFWGGGEWMKPSRCKTPFYPYCHPFFNAFFFFLPYLIPSQTFSFLVSSSLPFFSFLFFLHSSSVNFGIVAKQVTIFF